MLVIFNHKVKSILKTEFIIKNVFLLNKTIEFSTAHDIKCAKMRNYSATQTNFIGGLLHRSATF